MLTGNWESVNLHPTVIIYRNGTTYLLSIIHISETNGQARPSTYEIEKDRDGYYIHYNFKRIAVGYDAGLDILNLSVFGDYLRN
jgi:hypothetical protein